MNEWSVCEVDVCKGRSESAKAVQTGGTWETNGRRCHWRIGHTAHRCACCRRGTRKHINAVAIGESDTHCGVRVAGEECCAYVCGNDREKENSAKHTQHTCPAHCPYANPTPGSTKTALPRSLRSAARYTPTVHTTWTLWHPPHRNPTEMNPIDLRSYHFAAPNPTTHPPPPRGPPPPTKSPNLTSMSVAPTTRPTLSLVLSSVMSVATFS